VAIVQQFSNLQLLVPWWPMCTWFHIKKIWKVKDMACGTWRSVNRKLNESKRGLKVWQKVHGRNVGQHIQLLSAKLLEEKAKQDDVNPNLIKKLRRSIIFLLDYNFGIRVPAVKTPTGPLTFFALL
jgi:hypothetical protein